VGRGIALFEYPPGAFDRSNVSISIAGDGKATVVTGAPETGTGFHTVLAQLVAEHLGVAFTDVSVVQRDTAESGYERGASGSRLTTTVHQAVIMAATASKAALRALAAEHFACDVSQVRQTRYASYQAGDRSVDLKSLMSWAAAKGKAPMVHIGHNNPSDTSDVTSFAVQIAEVDVDVETGQVKVKRVVTAHDVGLIVNPITHQGQIEGGLVQGIGQALCEQLQFHDGAVVSATLGDYKLPTMADIPELVTVLVTADDKADGRAGKAIGEMSNAAIGAAIANAVYDAVGVRLTDLPLSAEKIYNALKSKAGAL
jgi:CO/xanthine dehydrogenase Mo-binding subunit